mgnify:CR=1 FL=1
METSEKLKVFGPRNMEPVPAWNVPFTHKFDANVEVAFVPVPRTSRKPNMVEVADVEVAEKERTVSSSVMTAGPFTDSVVPGVVDPMPNREFPVSVRW